MLNLNDQIGFNIYRVALLFRRELIRALKAYDLTPEQWQILATLWQQQALTQSQIIDLTLQDAPTASRTITRMQKKNLIHKHQSTIDKRDTIISLTKHGNSLNQQIPKILNNHFKPILQQVSKKDQQILLNILQNFRKILGDKV